MTSVTWSRADILALSLQEEEGEASAKGSLDRAETWAGVPLRKGLRRPRGMGTHGACPPGTGTWRAIAGRLLAVPLCGAEEMGSASFPLPDPGRRALFLGR